MYLRIIGLLICMYSFELYSQDSLKVANAVRAEKSPVIDGRLNDACWQTAEIIGDFKQYVPAYDVKPSYPTEVRIVYDDYGVYIGAMLYDAYPDSILRQLGNRDNEYLNADFFGVEFDTYNNNLDAYSFRVFASGVQQDFRENDETFDAVWRSNVQILENGWSVEIELPWSAIRFPNISSQVWGMELLRGIRRNREIDNWALEVKGAVNDIPFWGHLHGIEHIKSPLRLSLTPYLATAIEHYPYNIDGLSNYAYSLSGGMDLKYGINESFTFDATLLPDFTQVKSDNIVKNITAFETIYSEQRPFFKEAIDLFQKGNLFYSRRIGRTPSGYNAIMNGIDSTDKIIFNPQQTKLLNAVKLSGRTKGGLAIGILNAVTDRMCAEFESGNKGIYKIVTEPLSNYNILVFDQALRNNSSLYFINTNVWRENSYRKANVTGTGISLMNRSNKFNFSADGSVSQLFEKSINSDGFDNTIGYQINASAGKVSGKYQYSVFTNIMDGSFNANDLGLTTTNNYISNGIKLAYNIFEPTQYCRDLQSSITISNRLNYTTSKPESSSLLFKTYLTNLRYTSFWFTMNLSPFETYDYYEPRISGRYYITPSHYSVYFGFSSDYRKTFALDGALTLETNNQDYAGFICSITPILRINNHLQFKYTLQFENYYNDKGFAELNDDSGIIFGNRDITGVENSMTGTYNFRNNLSINLWARYYWYYGSYDHFFMLSEDGYLKNLTDFDGTDGFNFNSFNIDLTFNWEFAPGSNLTVMWKNAIITDDEAGNASYIENFKNTIRSPQLNTLSLKLLYYFDYQYLAKSKRK